MKASLKNYRQAPRKVRLVADMIRGKRLMHALTALTALPKKAALPLQKLLESAASNAAIAGNNKREELIVKEIRVDGGIVFTRSMPRARGRATPIRKRTSHVTLVLEHKAP